MTTDRQAATPRTAIAAELLALRLLLGGLGRTDLHPPSPRTVIEAPLDPSLTPPDKEITSAPPESPGAPAGLLGDAAH